MGRLEINCDLGEGEPFETTRRLMSLIDAANISCGVHGGDCEMTRECIGLAAEMGVRIGAHPGLATSGGRGIVEITADEFHEILYTQLSFFGDSCSDLGVSWNHVKLHGSLYHKVEVDSEFANAYANVLKELAPQAFVYSLADGFFAKSGLIDNDLIRGEIFADRSYQNDGSLTPRSVLGAVLSHEQDVLERLEYYLKNRKMKTLSGGSIPLHAETLCVHSDTENSFNILESIRSLLR